MSDVIERFNALPEDEYKAIVEYICEASTPLIHHDGTVGIAHAWNDTVQSTKLSVLTTEFLSASCSREDQERILVEFETCVEIIKARLSNEESGLKGRWINAQDFVAAMIIPLEGKTNSEAMVAKLHDGSIQPLVCAIATNQGVKFSADGVAEVFVLDVDRQREYLSRPLWFQ